ncbi:alpha 1,2-mannosyltransferase 2.4.1 [Kickxella alabastrina]|uniref:Alpha 1,2-mannosyltransferase 2.4.1 n=1 Tax=Kickxella alabastrina TaxID=61397 RepID=A0ACC1ITG2_9FUNG|nr:alpha 1,2-mannosyltransferase 2.4.1 [Kickxella alabastrina]
MILLLVVLAASVLYLAKPPPPIEKARMLTYTPDRIRDSRLKPGNTGLELSVRAGFVILVRNSELHQLRATIRQLEDQFNAQHSSDCHFGLVPYEHWSMPPWIDRVRAKWAMTMMASRVPYGNSESYRKMCRYEPGFFQRPLLDGFDYYWRVEPGVEFTCSIPYDPFKFMVDNNKSYGFAISLREFPVTVKTLWKTTNAFRAAYPDYIAPNNMLRWVTAPDGDYNMCHFWPNFEIASLAFLRSPQYTAYFDFLDRAGGFFLERWGDAPVHSLAVAMLLNKSQVHYFDIGYYHSPFQNCPTDPHFNAQHCFCNSDHSMIYNEDSCTND